MQARLRLITSLFALGLTAAHGAPAPGAATLNLQAVDQHILPSYQALRGTTARLAEHGATFCAAPDDDGLQRLRSDFADVMHDWQGIQHIRFGPIEYLTRAHRFQLWPDKRGTVRKHLQTLLAARDPAALEPDTFASGSVAVQGLSALERLLFGKAVKATDFTGTPAANYRCQVVLAIARNMADMGDRLVQDWADQRQAIATAHGGNDFYAGDDEVSAILLNNLHTQLQVMLEQKLERPLGESLAKARGKRAESWRSGLSSANLKRNLKAVHALYDIAFAPRLAGQSLRTEIDHAFEQARRQLDAIPERLDLAVADPAARPAVDAAYTELATLRTLIGVRMPDALGLSLGFNSLDGD